MNGTSGALIFLNLAYGERELTMSLGACKQNLLNPTQWLAITYAIAAAVNLREELITLLVMKAVVTSSLNSVIRSLLARISLTDKATSTLGGLTA
jgi:hypothetical protein